MINVTVTNGLHLSIGGASFQSPTLRLSLSSVSNMVATTHLGGSATSIVTPKVGHGTMMMSWKSVPVPDAQCFAAIRATVSGLPYGSKAFIVSGEFYGPPSFRACNLQLLNRYFERYPEDKEKESCGKLQETLSYCYTFSRSFLASREDSHPAGFRTARQSCLACIMTIACLTLPVARKTCGPALTTLSQTSPQNTSICEYL